MSPTSASERIILVDTNVLSYRFKKSPDYYSKYQQYFVGRIPSISFVTYGEALAGALEAEWSPNRMNQFESYLKTYLLIPGDINIVREYSKTRKECRQIGITVPDNDLWIAATARHHKLSLVTNDHIFTLIPSLRVLR